MYLQNPASLQKIPVRIVSLVPSITALLHSLQLENETIGITKFCIHPNDWYRNKNRIGGTKNVDIEKVRSLQPDLIIANKEENVKDQVDALAMSFPVLLTDVNNLEDALEMILTVGALTQKQISAAAICEIIKTGFENLQRSQQNDLRIPTAYLIWKDPYMTVGGDTYIHNMMQHAGFQNVFLNKTRYPAVTISDIQQSNCQLLLLSSEPYPFKENHIEDWKERLPGVQVKLVNGEMFSWYGSMLIDAPPYFEKLLSAIKVDADIHR